MSTTDKLAQALRISVGSMERAGWADHGDAYQRATLKKAREALASQSTPAGEVTEADAVEVAVETWKAEFVRDKNSNVQTRMRAVLAAALPALVQQVERLTAELDRSRRSVLSEELHALRAQVTEKTK